MTRCNTLAARWLAPGVVALAVSCGAGADPSDDGGDTPTGDGGGTPECFSSNECPTGWTCSEFGQCVEPPEGGGGEPPAEVEYELGDPVSSLRFVYVAMTELDALARIDGITRAVTSVPVGERPEVVATAPGSDTAVVLDGLNGTATIVRPRGETSDDPDSDPLDDQITFATLPHLNRVVIDPTGRRAVAWFDLQKAIADAGGLDAVDRIGSFQDVTILSLAADEPGAVDLTVGFRPRDVAFDDSGTRAFVITDDGISIIDLAAALAGELITAAPIAITAGPTTTAPDVSVVPGGDHAVVRQDDIAELRVVHTAGPDIGQTLIIPFDTAPSDVDLSPDGDRAYAVLRESAQLAIIDIPGDAVDPTGVELIELGEAAAGSLVLSRDGRRGALFTNATAREQITVIDLDTPDFTRDTWPLQKSVRTAHFDPSGDKLLVVHAKAAGDPDDATSFDEFIDRSHGYSALDVATGFAKLQITPVETTGVAFAPDAPRAYVILDSSAGDTGDTGDDSASVAEVQTIELDTGVVRALELGSPPDAVGVLPDAAVAFVSQRHPLGRITFIDIATDQVRTLTGFDLNSRVVD